MTHVRFDYSKALTFFNEHELTYLRDFVKTAHHNIHEKTGAGSDFLGWVDLPEHYDKEEFARIKKSAEKIKSDSDVLLVVGIGGSYLGARAAIEALNHAFYNTLPKAKRGNPQVIFIGNNISSSYMRDVMDLLEDVDFSINVISKSGTTTEPAIAFRIFRKLLEEKYGKEEAKARIYATTDKERGALKTLSNEEGFESFVIPDDVGGRYSVLTAVGLLPIAVSGVNIDDMMKGAFDASKDFATSELKKTLHTSMRSFAMCFTIKAKRLKCLSTMSRRFNILRSGGSSCSAKVKAKTRRAFILLLRTIQQTFTH